MTRTMLTREARERCDKRDHLGTCIGIWDGMILCATCGAFIGTDGEIDWPTTEAADRADIEAMGQGRLELE